MLLTVLIAAGIFVLLVVLQYIIHADRPVVSAFAGVVSGMIALCAVNLTGAFTGVTLPVSILSVGVSACAGIPGVTMLLILNLFC